MSAATLTEITVNARRLAIAWLNAFIAASDDEHRRVLYRTVSIEFFDRGIQIIGCDGLCLFRTWVGCEEADQVSWPTIDEDPNHAIVVMDDDRFGIAFMKAMLRATKEDGKEFEPITLTVAPNDEGATLALGDEFTSERLTLRACGQRLDLRLYEDKYVDWRHVSLGIEDAERVDGMVLASTMFGRVAKIRTGHKVDLAFNGDGKRVDFAAFDGPFPVVKGILMPMRREAES